MTPQSPRWGTEGCGLDLIVPKTCDAAGSALGLSATPGRLRRQGGFSLLELMVVIVLAMLLFAVVGVSVSRSIAGAEIRNAARDITAGIRHTRGQAIVTRQQQVFHVDARNRTWKASERDRVELPEGLEITLETARSELTGENAGGIRFYPDGASTGGCITLLAQEREWQVSVSWLTGEVSRECDP